MGILNFIKKQFIEVIEWNENYNPGPDAVMAYRYPMQDQEIKNGGQLTVRESQMAIFVNEGKIADVFGPGLYTLTTQTLPILTNLKNWDKAFLSPFKSDVYFFSTREQLNQKWGTTQPITVRDQEFGAIRLRANGGYSYQIHDPKAFFEKVSGTRDFYRVGELDGQLRSGVLAQIGTVLGTNQIPFLDMASNQQKFSETLKTAMLPFFAQYGLELENFMVESLSLPEDVQAYLDKSSSMKVIGDLGKYTQFQAAEALAAAANHDGAGIAGMGVGLGAGVGLGQVMSNALNSSLNPNANNASSSSMAGTAEDIAKALEKMHDLLKAGILTQAEFDAKKSDLLKKM